ncbi:MAG: ABC transporter ATP-binding protein [Paludibacteraceae bacterium]|nr:ABC transporter ATP-binding protein [Paludibacteraceae bacterium]
MNILTTENLSIGYKKTAIQQQLDLEVRAGEMVCLIGPNGSGKSTLLRTLCGLQKGLKGKIKIEGKDLTLLNNTQKALSLSFVLTDKVEVDNLSVFDLVFTGRYPHTTWLGNRTENDLRITDEAIDMVHLRHKRNSLINELSDGEKQRAMIAKALAQCTPLIFLDEPTAHLDLPNRVEIMLLLRRLAKETRKAIVLSTHELDLALQAADTIWLMNENGIKTGLPEDLVLEGYIEKTFTNPQVNFDSATGSFNMHYKTDKEIKINGKSTLVYWTKRALARAGYSISDNAAKEIIVAINSWTFNGQVFNSIACLVEYLENMK